jgi:hypothetical protein
MTENICQILWYPVSITHVTHRSMSGCPAFPSCGGGWYPKDGVVFSTEQNLTLSKSRRDLSVVAGVRLLASTPVEMSDRVRLLASTPVEVSDRVPLLASTPVEMSDRVPLLASTPVEVSDRVRLLASTPVEMSITYPHTLLTVHFSVRTVRSHIPAKSLRDLDSVRFCSVGKSTPSFGYPLHRRGMQDRPTLIGA